MSNTKKILVISFLVTFLLVIMIIGILVFVIPKDENLSKNIHSTDGIKTTVPTTGTTTSTTGKIKSQCQKFWSGLWFWKSILYFLYISDHSFSVLNIDYPQELMKAVKNQNLTQLQSILEETTIDVNTISENNE